MTGYSQAQASPQRPVQALGNGDEVGGRDSAGWDAQTEADEL